MQRINVTGGGITLTLVAEPLLSVFGKEMRPGATIVSALPWSDIAEVSLSATQIWPGDDRRVTLTVDVTWGEYFELHEDAEGVAEAIHKLCHLSGIPIPDMARPPAAREVIWAAPGSD